MENPDLESISEMPDKFPSVIRDFLSDMSTSFPEYTYLWGCWLQEDANISNLYHYCLTVYPERFFDILYQNDDIFKPTSEINTHFLPNVEFKMIFSLPDISNTIKQTIWKYLQLILITIMSSIKSSSSFGEAASMFEGINETELQEKLSETINGLADFFKNVSPNPDECPELSEEFSKKFAEDFSENFNKDGQPNMEKMFEKIFENTPSDDTKSNTFNFDSSDMPNVDELHNHIKGLFDGKIGSLAKELAEELSGDVMDMFGDGDEEVKSTGDIFKKMMKNPKQIMDLVKKISGKLDEKMKNGNISQEELMKEAGDLMSKMKGMGNGNEFQDMMQNMMKNMGPMMGGMMGKGAKMDMNKMTSMMTKNSNKERMLKKLEQKRAQAIATQKKYVLEQTDKPNEFVFKGEGVQEKSLSKNTDDWLDEPIVSTAPKGTSQKSKKKGKKGK